MTDATTIAASTNMEADYSWAPAVRADKAGETHKMVTQLLRSGGLPHGDDKRLPTIAPISAPVERRRSLPACQQSPAGNRQAVGGHHPDS